FAFGDKTARGNQLRASLASLQENSRKLCDILRTIVSRCSRVFFGTPPEVMWRIAERCTVMEVQVGELIVVEGEGGEAGGGEDLILIDEGLAVVEKRVGEGGRVGAVEIGRLGPGALVGDWCLLGAHIPRAASVRAKTDVQYILLPASALLMVTKMFPGVMEGLEPFVKEVGSFLQVRLPTRTANYGALALFAECSQAFINEVAGHSERQLCYAGQMLMDPEDPQGHLRVLEYGTLEVEAPEGGSLGEIATGSCFGDFDALGELTGAGLRVRVCTPLAIVSVTRAEILRDALRRHCGPQERWPRTSKGGSSSCGRDPIPLAAGIELFRNCSVEFVRDILQGALYRGYLPGQTLCVESAQFSHDAAHMFVLRSGQIVAGGDGQAPGEAGGSHVGFGELAMLGAEHKRPHTIRALTACFTLEVPRAAFVAAIARHPGEKHHFERFAVQVLQDGGSDEKCRWPFLANAPARLLYLLNLYAGLTAFRSGHLLLGQGADAPRMSAVLVVAGEVSVVSASDGVIAVLREGDCYNVRELLGVPGDDGTISLVARGACEAQILTKEVWDRVIAEFPESEVQDVLKSEIISHLASKAMTSRGIATGPLELLRRVRLLGAASSQLATWLTEHLEPLMVLPEDNVMVEGQKASRMFILLDGKLRSEYSCGTFVYSPGKVFSEAVLLGVVDHYLRTVTASTVCILQSLDRKHFQDFSRWTEHDLQITEPLLQEAQQRKHSNITADKFETRMMQKVIAFKNADPEFLAQLCENMEDKFMEPGEVVMAQGDECKPGVTPFYALISGELVLENRAGVFMGHVWPGETFGESGALGLSDTRSLTVRATLAGCVHCLKIEGVACMAAIRRFPSQRAALETIIDQRWHFHAARAKKRALWIRDKVVPVLQAHWGSPQGDKSQVLQAHWLFADTSREFVAELAVGLASAEYEAGKVIAKAGDAADSMLVLLEGTADVESSEGEVLGSLKAEAAIGEVALLGLFPLRLATLRATRACCVLHVTEKALRRALAELSDAGARKSERALAELAEQRRAQVQQGLPMTCLPLRVGQDNICVRAIALQARRISLAPRQTWECLPATHPSGPHFCVLASGRAVIEMRHEEDPGRRIKVLALNPGDLFMEDVASEFGMEVRATSVCEVFRVRKVDFRTAMARAPAAAEQWYPHFRMLEVEAVKVLRSRGQNVCGQLQDCQEHPNSEGIQLWKRRRDRAIARAPRRVLPAVLHSDSQPDLPTSVLKMPIKSVSAGRLPSLPLR
ncbi:unnamed protein product, partial [Prorocentrum cordatum]